MAETLKYEAPEIVDNYEHLDETLEYVLENVLSEKEQMEQLSAERQVLEEQYNSVLLNPCKCDDALQSCCDKDCCHGGNYMPHPLTAELVLCQEKRPDLIYECGVLCKCNNNSNRCRNRLVQLGPRKHLKIVISKLCQSKGLMTTVDIPRGAFICEYAGELLTCFEACRRNALNARDRSMNYILCLNEIELGAAGGVGGGGNERRQAIFVDPSRRGNIGRYLNHSCSPNCDIYSVRVDCPIPKIAIFSRRDICAGEELCFHYAGGTRTLDVARDLGKRKTDIAATTCLCGSEDCEQYLPNIEFQ